MIANTPPETIYDYITGDFAECWNSLAWNPSARNRGNFLFAHQAMTLLEFISRLAFDDASGNALRDFSTELAKIDPHYFTQLPGVCCYCADFDLPYVTTRGDELIWALFDLIRNGQAHQYEQIFVSLTDGHDFQTSLTGATLGNHLSIWSIQQRAQARSKYHLGYKRDSNNDLWMTLGPEILFLDLVDATQNSNLLKKGLNFKNLKRTSSASSTPKRTAAPIARSFYNFDSASMEGRLASAGHAKIP